MSITTIIVHRDLAVMTSPVLRNTTFCLTWVVRFSPRRLTETVASTTLYNHPFFFFFFFQRPHSKEALTRHRGLPSKKNLRFTRIIPTFPVFFFFFLFLFFFSFFSFLSSSARGMSFSRKFSFPASTFRLSWEKGPHPLIHCYYTPQNYPEEKPRKQPFDKVYSNHWEEFPILLP